MVKQFNNICKVDSRQSCWYTSCVGTVFAILSAAIAAFI